MWSFGLALNLSELLSLILSCGELLYQNTYFGLLKIEEYYKIFIENNRSVPLLLWL